MRTSIATVCLSGTLTQKMQDEAARQFAALFLEGRDARLEPPGWVWRLAEERLAQRRITRNFLEDIAKRWRDFAACCNRKRQTLRLPWPVVRVLPEDHHFDFLQRRERQRPQRFGRVDHRSFLQTRRDGITQQPPLLLRKKIRNKRLPTPINDPLLRLPGCQARRRGQSRIK